MSNPFINSSFTLRPSTNDRDRPELTLRRTEVSRIPKETAVTGNCMKGGRAFKRQRLFMDRSLSMTFARGFRVGSDEGRYYYDNQDQYISEEEYDTPIIQRRVSTEFPCRRPIDTTSVTTAMGANECDYWKSRCLGMQIACDDTQDKLREAEEDQRQMRQRIRELEEQLLLQSCNGTKDETPTNRDGGTDSSVEGTNKNKNINNNQAAQQGNEGMNCEFDEKKWVPPALVVEIKENYQAVSSCFYLTDGEGLNESYDLEMEDEEGISMDVNVCDNMLDDIDDDRNDINMNQRRG